jgi:hypothetical protein
MAVSFPASAIGVVVQDIVARRGLQRDKGGGGGVTIA